MIPDSPLPTCNAFFNLVSIVFLLRGYAAVRAGNTPRHRRNMLRALAAAVAFLTSYLIYHFSVGSVPYPFHDWLRPVYYAVLVPHVVMAGVTAPFILITVRRALAGDFARHKRLARRVFPAWMFVAVTGVLVYLLLYGRMYMGRLIGNG